MQESMDRLPVLADGVGASYSSFGSRSTDYVPLPLDASTQSTRVFLPSMLNSLTGPASAERAHEGSRPRDEEEAVSQLLAAPSVPWGTEGMYLLPHCSRPVTGPGRAVRAPPGTAYYVGGAVLRREIVYDALGHATLQVVYEPIPRDTTRYKGPRRALRELLGRDTATTEGEDPVAPAAPIRRTGGSHPNTVGAVSQAPSESVLSHLGFVTDAGNDPAVRAAAATTAVPNHSGAAGDEGAQPRPALPPSMAERAYAREQEAFFAHVANTQPLLKVLPPAAILEEQRYVAVDLVGAAGSAPQATEAPRLAAASLSRTLAGATEAGGQPSPFATDAAHYEAALSAEGHHSWPAQTMMAVQGAALLPQPPRAPSPSPELVRSFVVRLGTSVDEANTLRALAWGGCRPVALRAITWRLLSDYAPPSLARQRSELARKRRQYDGYVNQYIDLAAVQAYILQNTSADGASGGAGQGGRQGSVARLSAYSAISLGSSMGSGVAGGSGGPRKRIADGFNPGGASAASPAFASAAASSAALAHLAPHERAILSQLALDLPRHRASFFHCDRTAAAMARCLFLWAQRHPAVGYVQGMDDLMAVFFQVFLTDALRQRQREKAQHDGAHVESSLTSEASDADLGKHALGREGSTAQNLPSRFHPRASQHPFRASFNVPTYVYEHQVHSWSAETLNAALDDLPEAYLLQAEADTYWCGGRVLSVLQDNFTQGQPGLVRAGARLEVVVQRADPSLFEYLTSLGVGVKEMCFQWLHCMLVREFPLPMCLSLWDTYLCIGGGGDSNSGGGAVGGVGLSPASGGVSREREENVGRDELASFHVYVCAALIMSMRSLMTERAPLDVVMGALKSPYDYLFRRDSGAGTSTGVVGGGSGMSRREKEWMSMLIADAYRLWKMYPV